MLKSLIHEVDIDDDFDMLQFSRLSQLLDRNKIRNVGQKEISVVVCCIIIYFNITSTSLHEEIPNIQVNLVSLN